MSLIRRQNPEARERMFHQRQHISSPSSTNDSSPILMECSSEYEGENPDAVASTPTEQESHSCSQRVINYSPPYAIEQQNKLEEQSSGNSSSFEKMSSWDTYWRQMSGPPPYKGKQNREIFQLVLKTRLNASTETRYYVEEPMERDPHCLTSDQAQAMISIAPNVYHGSVVADWTGLTSASIEEETVLTLAVPIRPKIDLSLKEREHHNNQQMSTTFIFFLFGYRHANVHDDYKKACPTECNHEAHQLTESHEPKLPELRFRVADLNSNLRFSNYPCIISSPAETLSFSSTGEEIDIQTTQYKGRRQKSSVKRNRYPQLALKIASVAVTNKQEAAKSISSIVGDKKNETAEKHSSHNMEATEEPSIGKGTASAETSQQR